MLRHRGLEERQQLRGLGLCLGVISHVVTLLASSPLSFPELVCVRGHFPLATCPGGVLEGTCCLVCLWPAVK